MGLPVVSLPARAPLPAAALPPVNRRRVRLEGGNEAELAPRGGNLRLAVRFATLAFVALFVAFAVLLLVRDWPQTVNALRHADAVVARCRPPSVQSRACS